MAYFWGWGDKVQYVVIGVDGRVRKTIDVQVSGSPMMHDFSLTERHVVIYDLPVTFDVDKVTADVPKLIQPVARFGVSQIAGRSRLEPVAAALMRAGAKRATPDSMTLPYSWNPSYPARVGVMSRDGDGSDVRWYDIEPCYVYHPLNAYDDGDRVVLDVVRHPKMFATDHNGPSEGPPMLYRWVVDQAAGKVVEEQRGDHAQEFPRVDERVVGRRHRYGYAVGFTLQDGLTTPTDVLKHDMETGGTEVRSLGAGTQPGEFVFVPSSPDAAEDEGVLLGIVFDPATDRSELTVLDATTLETVALVHLPARVPAGFHGNWVPTP
jgi:carotenoid cleavage dioxygenase